MKHDVIEICSVYLICIHIGLYTIYLCINSGLLDRVKITDTKGYLPVFMSIYLHLFHIHIHWNVLCYSGKSNQPTSVSGWLSSLDLDTQYLDKFNNMDFSTMARCQQIWEVELASVSFFNKILQYDKYMGQDNKWFYRRNFWPKSLKHNHAFIDCVCRGVLKWCNGILVTVLLLHYWSL